MRPLATAVSLLAAASFGALAGCGGSDGAATNASTQAKPSGCQRVAAPAPKGEQHLRPPTQGLDPSKRWTATVATNCGTFTIKLAVRAAPKTAASFAYLARKGFYDGLTFHRVAPDFVIQGGDPLGNGSGGPGYTLVERPPQGLDYLYGVVAMAKGDDQPDGASGSQFFVVIAEDASVPPQYAWIGKVTRGFDVITRIGNLELRTEDPGGGPPIEPVVIDSVKISSS